MYYICYLEVGKHNLRVAKVGYASVQMILKLFESSVERHLVHYFGQLGAARRRRGHHELYDAGRVVSERGGLLAKVELFVVDALARVDLEDGLAVEGDHFRSILHDFARQIVLRLLL